MIHCLIVDDEPIAREILLKYCSALPWIKVEATCENAVQAKVELTKHPIDLIFLDINMPLLDGISFLKTIKKPPQIIFTTAYKEYAVDAFDLSACDYLVKPFSFDRFIVAVDKAMERLSGKAENETAQLPAHTGHHLFIKSDGKVFKVDHSSILYAEAKGNYTEVVTEGYALLTPMSFSAFESALPKTFFIRVHRSFIINNRKIDHIEGNTIQVGKAQVPIGSSYKEEFFRLLKF